MSNQIVEIYPFLIFFLIKTTRPPKRSLLSFISSFRLISNVFIPVIKAHKRMLAWLNGNQHKKINQFWAPTTCLGVPRQFQKVNRRYSSRSVWYPSLYRYSNLVVSFVPQLTQLNRLLRISALRLFQLFSCSPAFYSVTTQKNKYKIAKHPLQKRGCLF